MLVHVDSAVFVGINKPFDYNFTDRRGKEVKGTSYSIGFIDPHGGRSNPVEYYKIDELLYKSFSFDDPNTIKGYQGKTFSFAYVNRPKFLDNEKFNYKGRIADDKKITELTLLKK